MEDSLETAEKHASPPLVVLATAFSVMFVGSVVAHFWMTSGAPYPTPYRPLDELQSHFREYGDAQRVIGFFQFGAAIPLGLFSAVVVSRLRFLNVTVAGVHIALFGGLAASIFLAMSALCSWMLSQPGIAADVGAMRIAQLLAFATGGVGHTATLGLLLAGVSVPALAFGLMPRWVSWMGLGLAAIAELSVLSLLFPVLSPLLPLARFPALVWLIAAAVFLPTHRVSVPHRASPDRRSR